MSYQVIARKWRPQTFAEVTGQEHITRTLRNAIEHERLHHAYLFSGARGVGKTTTARLLAKALNCRKTTQPTPTPCAFNDPTACASCREIAEGRSMDVLEIDAASNTGVDNVREAIIGNIAVAAARDRYKVFIIDEVHMLSGAAFNALLKTLEEPPSRVVFVLATTEKHKLPETILSRCQQFEFRTISTVKIAERLRLIADAESVAISEAALREVARAGEGSMRDAQSAFDQVISFATGAEIVPSDVETALGIAGRDLLARAMQAVTTQQPAEMLAVVDDLVMRGHDLRNFCRDLLGYLRDLLVVKISDAPAMLDASDEERTALAAQAAHFNEADLTRLFHSLTATETSLKTAAQPRYQLEIGLVKLAEMRRLASLGDILARLAALENALRDGGATLPPASAPTAPVPPVTPRQVVPPAPPAAKVTTPARPAAPPPDAPFAWNSAPGQQPAASKTIAAPPSQVTPPLPPVAAAVAPAVRRVGNAEPPAWRDDESWAGEPVSDVAPARSAAPLDLSQMDSAILRGQIVSELERQGKMLQARQLEKAQHVAVRDSELIVEFAPEDKGHRDSLGRIDHRELLRQACQALFGQQLTPQVRMMDAPRKDTRQAAARVAEQERHAQLRAHPVVQDVIKLFGGEIVSVTPRVQ